MYTQINTMEINGVAGWKIPEKNQYAEKFFS